MPLEWHGWKPQDEHGTYPHLSIQPIPRLRKRDHYGQEKYGLFLINHNSSSLIARFLNYGSALSALREIDRIAKASVVKES